MKETLPLILGYLAFILLAISLLVNNEIRFRWLNSMGSLSFVLYGLMIDAFPIIITNGLLLCINIFYLIKIYTTDEDFDLIEFFSTDSLIQKYFSFYQKDILTFFPNFSLQDKENELRFIVLRDLAFANIFVAQISPEGIAFVKINYTVPKYRDFKVGRFIFEKENKYLRSKGIKQIVYKEVINKNHIQFLKIMKFKKVIIDGNKCYAKELS